MHKKITDQPFENAFLVAKRPYLEKKVILTLLTENHGIICAMTHQSKQKRPHLEPFTPLACQLLIKNSISQLKKIETQNYYPPLQGQYIFAGLYMNELIYRLFQPNEPQEELFELYQKTLEKLANKKPLKHTIRTFEHALQTYLGYGLNTHILKETDHPWFVFNTETGLTPSPTPTAKAIPRKVLSELAKHDLTSQSTQQASKMIFTEIIKYLLGEKSLFITQIMPKEH